MLDWLVFFGVIGGGGFLAFRGWAGFTNATEEASFQRQLEVERGRARTPQQRAAERDVVRGWAEQELRRVRRERNTGHE